MDLYALLGVSRAASATEVERAYRRLARRYHPGVNPGDRMAAELYRQVQYAFEVLGDEARRREYDTGGHPPPASTVAVSVSLEGFDFATPAAGADAATFAELFADVFEDAAREATTPSRGSDLDLRLRLSFKDAVLGGSFPMSVVRQDRCPACAGDGLVPQPAVECPACRGQGAKRWARGSMVFGRTCERCQGTGRLSARACRQCAGVGLQARSEVVTVIVPAGMDAGERLAVSGRGHAGARRGPAGDLYVTIDVEPHRYLTRQGRDLRMTLPVAVHEAGLGARMDVPTLAGTVRVKIPAGTPSGWTLRVRGQGVPAPAGAPPEAAGDLIITLQIVLPPVKDERSRELLREFGQLNNQSVRDF